MIRYLLNRALFLLWVALCIFDAFVLSVSLLTFSSAAGVCAGIVLLTLLPQLYQLGLDHCDFEACMNMFEGEDEEENDEDEE